MRYLAYLVFILLLLLALPLTALVGLAATETGTRWLMQTVVYLAPGELRLGQVRGTLLHHLELDQLRYLLPSYRLELTHLSLTWEPKGLFSGQIDIEEIKASGLHYQRSTTSPPPVSSALPSVRLPFNMTIRRAELNEAVIIQDNARLRLDRILLKASLRGDQLNVDELSLFIRPFSLTARGEIRLRRGYPLRLTIAWQGELSGQHLAGEGHLGGDLRRLAIDHRLTLPFTVTTQGTLDVLDPELTAQLEGTWQNLSWPAAAIAYSSPAGYYRVHGHLNDFKLELNADLTGQIFPVLKLRLAARGDAQSLVLAPLTVHLPKGQLTVHGRLSWAPALAWQLTVEGENLDPQAFSPDWPGSLKIKVQSQGRWEKPKLEFDLAIERFQGTLRQKPVSAKGALKFQDGHWQSKGLSLSSGANRLRLQGRYGKRLDLAFAFEGYALHELWPGISGTLQAQGALSGTLKKPMIRAKAQGQSLSWRKGRLGKLRMRLDLAADDPNSHGELSISQLQLRDFEVKRFALSARGGLEQHRLDFDLELPQSRLAAVVTGHYSAKIWHLASSQLDLKDAKGRSLSFPQNGTLAVEANLDFNTRPVRVVSRLDLDLPDLSRLDFWLAPLDRPEGQITLALRADGPITALHPGGRMQLSRGAFGIRPAGVRLSAVEATLVGSGKRWDLTGHLRAGDGSLTILGQADLPKLHLTFKGRDLEVVKRTQARIVASPDLALDFRERIGHLTGTILIPKADLRLKALPKGSVTVSKDEIIVGTEAKSEKPPLILESRLHLILGDEVSFTGLGLNAKLGGNLDVSSRDHQIQAMGTIDLKQASYQAYGQKLTLAKGRLIFTGPVDQPYLELKTSRKIEAEGIIVSLEVRGPAQKPEVSITSQPPRPQTEALSLLLFGRSLTTSGMAEQTEGAQTAIALGLDVALPWLRMLGLETLATKAGIGFQEEAVGLGKYLTPDLYLGYAFTVFNGVGKALLRYRINRFLSLEASAGASQSVDLLYTLETD